jgi:Spy/CpxP family protein refolding chaperone
MARLSRYLLVAVVAFAAALGATWLSRSLAEHGHPEGGTLHVLMHEQLDLDAAQEAKVEVLEGQFAERRKSLDAQLRQTNAELASAIANEHQYGPKVAEAVDRSHMAMGDLQKATLSHVFAMRAVLRPDQASRFDTAVTEALTRSDDE